MSYSIINDPIHGTMSFPSEWKELLKSLIDSENFQRLRHIRQLGVLDLIFPTAVHTRFSHCLGTAYVAYQMGEKIKLDKDKLQHVVVAALLHDIGHGPFSHMFEKLYKELKVPFSVNHEAWTLSFLKGYEKIFENYNLDYKRISNLIMHNHQDSSDWGAAADIVSSQLDADRLDYLLRDSHFCGVNYGKIEIQWILKHLEIVNFPSQRARLGLSKKGWHAAEHFLISRSIMNKNVYQHPKNRVLEKLVINLLSRLSDALVEMDGTDFDSINKNLRKFLLSLKDKTWSSTDKEKFISENFEYYKTLVDYDIWMLIRDFSIKAEKTNSPAIEEIRVISQRIYERKLHDCYKLEASSISIVKAIMDEFIAEKGIPSWKVFITDNQIKLYDSDDKEAILIQDNVKNIASITFPSTVRKLTYYSHLVDMVRDQEESQYYLAIDTYLDDKLKTQLAQKMVPYIS
jgi:hypothetical protein